MSSYASGKFKQDMPPPGGYSDIHYQRIPAQRLIGYKSAFLASCVLSVYSLYYYNNRRKYLNRMWVDYKDYLVAVEPLSLAEQDRAFLRHLRHNRNVERDLMKNVPGWKIGTLWGQPVYKNLPENALPNVSVFEFYGHRNINEMKEVVWPNRDVGLEDTDNDK